jgi:hypothetical protein
MAKAPGCRAIHATTSVVASLVSADAFNRLARRKVAEKRGYGSPTLSQPFQPAFGGWAHGQSGGGGAAMTTGGGGGGRLLALRYRQSHQEKRRLGRRDLAGISEARRLIPPRYPRP